MMFMGEESGKLPDMLVTVALGNGFILTGMLWGAFLAKMIDRQLRSDGIRATVFRQTQSQDGRWIDSPVDAKTATDFENSILTRARQLRIANVQSH